MTLLFLRPLHFLLFIILFNPVIANAESLLAPQQVIAEMSQVLLKKMAEPGFITDKTKVRQFVDRQIFPHVDSIRMSALVLGKHWRTASTEQKKRFIHAFKNLLVNTYSATFTKQFNNWSIHYLPLTLNKGAKKALVKTIVSQPGKPSAKIDYSMILRKNQWKVYDLTVEGISLIISNRTIFNEMLQKSHSLDAVIADIEEKNGR